MIGITMIDFREARFYAECAYVPVAVAVSLLVGLLLVRCSSFLCLPKRTKKVSRTSAMCVRGLVFMSFVLTVIAALMTFIGNSDLNSGIKTAYNTEYDVRNRLDTISTSSERLSAYGTKLADDAESMESLCPSQGATFRAIRQDVEKIIPTAAEVASQSASVSSDISDFRTQSHGYAFGVRDAVILGVVGLILTIVVLNAIEVRARYRKDELDRSKPCASSLKCCAAGIIGIVSSCLFVLLILIVLIELYLFVIGTQFCVDPTTVVLDFVPSGTPYEYATYYSSCEGTAPNPIVDKLGDVEDLLRAVSTYLGSLETECPESSLETLQSMQLLCNNSTAALSKIDNLSTCESIKVMWDLVLEDAVCDDGIRGARDMTICNTVSAGMALALLFMMEMWRNQSERAADEASHGRMNAYHAFSGDVGTEAVIISANANSLDPEAGDCIPIAEPLLTK